jgi:hypothetical protein
MGGIRFNNESKFKKFFKFDRFSLNLKRKEGTNMTKELEKAYKELEKVPIFLITIPTANDRVLVHCLPFDIWAEGDDEREAKVRVLEVLKFYLENHAEKKELHLEKKILH